MTGFQEFQQPTHAYNPWIGAKPDHNMESASEREWKRLEAKGVVDKFRRLIPKPKPGEGVTHKHQYPLGEGRKWPQHDCPYDNGQPGPVVASSLERRE